MWRARGLRRVFTLLSHTLSLLFSLSRLTSTSNMADALLREDLSDTDSEGEYDLDQYELDCDQLSDDEDVVIDFEEMISESLLLTEPLKLEHHGIYIYILL